MVYLKSFYVLNIINLLYYICLKNVFLKNIDIWGFLMAYSPLLELNVTLDIDEIISYIYITKLYEHATQPININQLVQQLEYLVL